MPDTLLAVDLKRSAPEQEPRPHNRWHPEIPPVASVEAGAVFRLECLDLTGGQILNTDTADDVVGLDFEQLHYLTGPIAVNDARPGDLLVVDILDLGPLPGAEWGFTVIPGASENVGLLDTDYPQPAKAVWDLNGIYATSRHIADVRFAGLPHPGVIGCAPSAELLGRWNERERAVVATTSNSHLPPMGLLPTPSGALLGELPQAEAKRIVGQAARTWAARENGGNVDVKDLARGSRAFLPIYVPGARLSIGDLQFSQGDGKITGFGGIKMAGWIDLHVDLIRDGMNRYGISAPVFEPSPVVPGYDQYLTFQGISVDDAGHQHYLDAMVAYRQACRHAIRHFERYGFTGEQAYVLLSAAPVEGHVSCLLEHPNVCCTVAVPKGIFEFDMRPWSERIQPRPRSELAHPS